MISRERAEPGFRRPRFDARRWQLVIGRQEREVGFRELDRLELALDEHVAAAGNGGVHLGAAHFLERDLLADHHLGHARRAEVHAGIAVDHHDHVAKRRDVRAARRRRPKQQTQLRNAPAQADLIEEDAPGAAAPGKHLDLVGDARAGRVDQVQERAEQALRGLLNAQDFLDRALAPRARPSPSNRWP